MAKYIIRSIKTGKKIAYEGHFYNFKDDYNDVLKWRCNKKKCLSVLKTTKNYDLIIVGSHNHPIDKKFNQVLLKEKIKDRALNSAESSRNVLLSAIKDDDIKYEGFNYKYLADSVTKYRKIKNFTMAKEYDIPIELFTTEQGKQFLQYDSGVDDAARIIIFSTYDNIEHLKYNNIFLCDGTFKSSPVGFTQIYTVQCFLRGKYLPLIFCLMKKKNLDSYKKFLIWLKFEAKVFINNFQHVILDYEQASFSAFKEIFPNMNLHGCAFHLGQIVWRRIQTFGYTRAYKANSNFKFNIKLLLSLAFVPEEHVLEESLKLENFFRQDKQEDALIVFNWFKTNYRKENQNENASIRFWNLHDRTINNIPRTTNSLEGFHRHLNTFISNKNPGLFYIVNELKKEQVITENFFITSLYTNHVQKYDKMKSLLEKYYSFYGLDFLRAVAYTFNWKFN